VQPKYAKKLVDDWLCGHPEIAKPGTFEEALIRAVKCRAYVVSGAKRPIEYMWPSEAKEMYPRQLQGRF